MILTSIEYTHIYIYRSQEERKQRHAKRESGLLPLDTVEDEPDEQPHFLEVEEYKDVKGSFDTGDPLTTNLYVGNINPKVTEWCTCTYSCM